MPMANTEDGPIDFKTIVYKGITLWNCDMGRIRNMEILDDDVFVCTYPRSGKPVWFGNNRVLT